MVAALQKMYGLPLEAETVEEAVGFYRKRGFTITAYQHPEWGEKYTCILEAQAVFTIEELTEAHRALSSTLQKCEKIDIGKMGKSQRTLLERRIAALKLALALIEKEQVEHI
jgi:Pyruvate/2-oxoacid:ferredoxin oxidoreductase gamma subunit